MATLIRIVDASPLIATAVWLALLVAGTWLYIGGGWHVWRETMADVWSLLLVFLRFQGRWRLLLTQFVLAVGGFLFLFYVAEPVATHDLASQAGFLQTAAQVQAGVLVALALTQYGDDLVARCVRPAVAVAVMLGSLALLAAVAATSPSLPDGLGEPAFALAGAGGVASLGSLVQISWRLLR